VGKGGGAGPSKFHIRAPIQEKGEDNRARLVPGIFWEKKEGGGSASERGGGVPPLLTYFSFAKRKEGTRKNLSPTFLVPAGRERKKAGIKPPKKEKFACPAPKSYPG